jgi:uncharacterized RDD family membrane protein YckC
MMSKLILKRILAFGLDYLIITGYGMVLFGVTTSIGVAGLSPLKGQVVGFVSLTIPVFLYFFLMEKSSSAATLGKRVMNISVQTHTANNSQKIFVRNILKFLPWEIAHFGIHWIMYYSEIDKAPPVWVWVSLILPQLIVFIYMLSIVLYKGESSFYDRIANTKIVIKPTQNKE